MKPPSRMKPPRRQERQVNSKYALNSFFCLTLKLGALCVLAVRFKILLIDSAASSKVYTA